MAFTSYTACTTEERWLYLLKHAGKADCLPDFDDSVISDAIKRLLVNSAPDKLIREQARDMVLTEEELDHLAAMKVRARREGLAEGELNGIDKSLDVFRSLGVSDEMLEKASQILANSTN